MLDADGDDCAAAVVVLVVSYGSVVSRPEISGTETFVVHNPSEVGAVPMGRSDVLFPSNRGYAAAVGAAIADLRARAAKGDGRVPSVVIVRTQDVVTQAQDVFALASALLHDRSLGFVGPVLLNPNGEAQVGATCSRWGRVRHTTMALAAIQLGPVVPVDWVDGALIGARYETWLALEPLDQGTFLYGEDVDWCWQARQLGLTIGVVTAAHAEQRSGMASRSGVHGYLLARNGAVVARRRVGIVGLLAGLGRAGEGIAKELVKAVAAPRVSRTHHVRQAVGMAWGAVDAVCRPTGPPPRRLRDWGDVRGVCDNADG